VELYNALDTKIAVWQRRDELRFIEDKFAILKGKIDYENSMVLTVTNKL
jgi:hypothetical protein